MARRMASDVLAYLEEGEISVISGSTARGKTGGLGSAESVAPSA
jgi:hypothetical protein